MAVAFDAAANGNDNDDPNFSHSLGAASGNNRIVIVGIVLGGGSTHTIDGVTYDGAAMTQLDFTSVLNFGATRTSVYFYYLLDSSLPASTGSYTVSITTTGPDNAVGICASYTGVSQSAPPSAKSSGSNDGGTSGQFSTNITLAASTGMLVDIAGARSTTSAMAMAPGTSQTERNDTYRNYATAASSEKAFSSSGSNSMAQTPSNTYRAWGHILAELAEAGAPPPVSNNPAVMGACF